MLYQCDEVIETNLFKGEYCSSLSSDDVYDLELPLIARAKGGTMAMWKRSLDNHVYRCPSPSSSLLPIIFSPLVIPPRFTSPSISQQPEETLSLLMR